MRTLKSIFSLSSFVATTFVLTATTSLAWAQPSDLMLDPGGESAAPAEAPAPQGASAIPAGAQAADAEAGANQYYGDYLGDDLDMEGEDWQPGPHQGAIPSSHTVVQGDTLWDISAYYYNNPWEWPKVWALNPEVKDPHWIYPGNNVRLRQGGQPVAALAKDDHREGGISPSTDPGRVYSLKQIAYIDIDDLKDAGRIIGSVDEKSLLSARDSVYLDYENGTMPKVGDSFAVYSAGRKVKRDGKVVGHYVEVAGELRITFVQEGKRARAVLTSSLRAMERGMRVGPLELNFSNIQPVINQQQVDGEIVDLIGPDELIGSQAAVLVDRGRADGVQVGNRFLVSRRGDAYRKVMLPNANIGQDDEKFPLRAIGEIIILQVGEQVSMGVVTLSLHEFGVGDRVLMLKGK